MINNLRKCRLPKLPIVRKCCLIPVPNLLWMLAYTNMVFCFFALFTQLLLYIPYHSTMDPDPGVGLSSTLVQHIFLNLCNLADLVLTIVLLAGLRLKIKCFLLFYFYTIIVLHIFILTLGILVIFAHEIIMDTLLVVTALVACFQLFLVANTYLLWNEEQNVEQNVEYRANDDTMLLA